MYNLPCRETKRCFSSNLIIFSITNRNSSEVIGTSLKSHEVYSVTRTKTTMEIVYYGIQLKSFTLQEWIEYYYLHFEQPGPGLRKNGTNQQICSTGLKWLSLNIQAIKAKTKLYCTKKSQSMAKVWMQLRRTYWDFDSKAGPAKENWVLRHAFKMTFPCQLKTKQDTVLSNHKVWHWLS